MKTTNKVLIVFAAVFFLAAGCGKQTNQPTSESVNQQDGGTVNQQTQVQSSSAPDTMTPKPNGQTQTKDNANGPDYFPNGQKLAGQLTVTQSVEGSNLNVSANVFTQGQTALELLKATHKVEVKSYSFGDMVTSIDGKAADSKHFWEFFVNGKSSNVGASSYQLQAGDKLEWKLSVIR